MVKNLRGGNISVLDDELLVQILCRLGSFKYAVQCKSVCKFWCSAIDTSSSDSHFLCRGRQINNKEEGKLPPVFVTQYACVNKTGSEYRHSVDCNSKELPSLDLNFMPSDGPICILSSSKDLLLCCPYPYDHSCYYLCNPFTKQWTTLPPPPSAQQGEVWITEDIKIGFIVHDHDHGRDINFTVLRIVPYKGGGRDYYKDRIFVFSSGGDSGGGWRHIMDSERATWRIRMFLVYYKEMLSFFQYETRLGGDLRIGFKLDAAGGSPTRFVFPPKQNPDPQLRFRAVIGVCGGALRLAELVCIPLMLVVWQLDDGERQEWDMVHELDINEMAGGLEDSDMVRCYPAHEPWKVELSREPWKVEVYVLAFHPHDGDILYLSFCLRWRKNAPMYIFSYDLKKSKLELIRAFTTTHNEHGKPHGWPEPGFFSLVPPCWPTPVPRLQP